MVKLTGSAETYGFLSDSSLSRREGRGSITMCGHSRPHSLIALRRKSYKGGETGKGPEVTIIREKDPLWWGVSKGGGSPENWDQYSENNTAMREKPLRS